MVRRSLPRGILLAAVAAELSAIRAPRIAPEVVFVRVVHLHIPRAQSYVAHGTAECRVYSATEIAGADTPRRIIRSIVEIAQPIENRSPGTPDRAQF
jgi:hypothetical protein